MVTTALTAKDIVAGILADVAAREARLPFLDIKALSRAVPAPRPVAPLLSQPGLPTSPAWRTILNPRVWR